MKIGDHMKTAALLLAFLATACCHADSPATGHKLGINLGKQNAPVALLSGNNNDVEIAPNGGTTTYLRFTVNSANSTMTGMKSASVGDGDMFVIRNESATGSLFITNEDTLSLAANRFLTAGAVTLQIQPRSSALAEWDSTLSRFMVSLAAPANPTFVGNVSANGSAIPVLTSCGTGPAIVAGSTDFAGNYTTGSAATTCTITFATAFGVAPTCLITNGTGAATLIPTYSTSATAITVSVDIASTAYQYLCVGH
jgi:hypothetical protein